MRVYRCIKFQEVINKYKNQKNRIINNNKLNMHKYKENTEYIHFFRYEAFAIYYFGLHQSKSLNVLKSDFLLFMLANIPEHILNKYLSFGFYTYKGKEILIPEYAIPTEEFLPEYVVDMTTYPGGNSRENEKEEFEKYIELVEKLKSSGMSIKEIASFFLTNNFEEMLEIKIDKRSEEEIEYDWNLLLSKMSFPKNDDIEIEEKEYVDMEFKR